MSKFEFLDRLPESTSRGRKDPLLDEFVDALRRRTGEWAAWPKPLKGEQSARSYGANIRAGRTRRFASKEFDARVVDGTLYVRHAPITKGQL